MTVVIWHGETTTKQRTAAPANQRLVKLGEKDDAILSALTQYYFLSAEQLTRLFYSKGSLAYVQKKLKTLTDAGYTQRVFYHPTFPARATYVYHIARKGLTYLRELGREVDRRYRPSETGEVSDFFLRHTLACNDVTIGAHLLQ